MTHFILHRGELVPAGRLDLDPSDRGLLYGFSLFETMLVHRGMIVLLGRHLDRLARSAGELGMGPGVDTGLLAWACRQAVLRSGTRNGVLRLSVTAGPHDGGDGVTVLATREGVPYPSEKYDKGFALLVLDFARNENSPLVRHKTANYLENLLGRRVALQRGYDEGIFLNTRGNVAEGTASNIFVVQRGELLTPPPGAGLLPGTVRQLVLEMAGGLGLKCRESHLTPADLGQAEECFLTNSLLGVMPVTQINGAAVGGGRPGPVTRIISTIYPGTED